MSFIASLALLSLVECSFINNKAKGTKSIAFFQVYTNHAEKGTATVARTDMLFANYPQNHLPHLEIVFPDLNVGPAFPIGSVHLQNTYGFPLANYQIFLRIM